jgi:quinol monooxygenase YgiN
MKMIKHMHNGVSLQPEGDVPSGSEAAFDGGPMTGGLQMDRRSLVTKLGLAAAAAAAYSAPIAAHAAQTVALPVGAVTVVAFVRTREGKEAELVQAAEALVPKVRQEAGNLLCQVHQGLEEPSLFAFYEVFESAAALEAHKSTPHVKQWSMAIQSLIAGPVELKLLKAFG